MIRVYAGDRQIDLADNPYIESQLNSPFVGQQQNGSVVYPFTAPFTPNNDAIFEYFRLPEASIDRTKTHIGRMYDDNILIVEGILSIKESDKTYSVEIAGPPAGVSESFWSKNLRKIDIGSHEFDKRGVTTKLYSIKVTPEIEPYFGLKGSTIKIYTPTRNYVTYDFPVALGNFYNELYDSGTNRTLGEILQPVAYKFNEDNNLRSEGYELVISSKGINFFAPETLTNNLTLKLMVEYDVGTRGKPIIKQKVFDFILVTYLTPVLTGLENLTTLNSPFVFPTIYNPGFYGSNNKIFSKFVNWFDGKLGVYPENTYRNPTAYTLVPMMSLHFVIKQLLLSMNYSSEGAFFESQDMKLLYIENMKSIDLQCSIIDLPFNVFATSFQFKDHLPDVSVQEFFDEIKNYFGLSIEYDIVNRKARFDFIEPVLTSTDNEDYSDKVYRISLSTSQVKKIQFSPNSEYIPEADKTHEVNLSLPLDEIVALEPDNYTTLKSKISTLPVQIVEASETVIIRPGGSTITEVTAVQSGPVRIYPYCNQTGNSPLYEQNEQSWSFRLLFYLGKQKDPQDVTIIRSDYKTNTLNLILSNDPTSRYSLYLKAYKIFLETGVEAETDVFLTDAEIAAFNWRLKKYIRGIHYLVHQLTPTLPVRKAFKMKMKRIL